MDVRRRTSSRFVLSAFYIPNSPSLTTSAPCVVPPLACARPFRLSLLFNIQYYYLMILSSVYMPQGGSLQRSKGLKRNGPVLIESVENTLADGQKMPKSPQNGGSNPIFRHSDRTFRTRAWRVAPCRRPAAPLRKFHTKCVPSQLILRMKNSGSEESLAVGCTRFCVRHFPPGPSVSLTY